MKTCKSCVFRKNIAFGDTKADFCTGLPPTAIVTNNPAVDDKPASVTVTGHYPPVPGRPCALYRRKWWRIW